MHRGVYLVGHAEPPSLAREWAALLACGEGAVLSHHTASALWRLRPSLPPTVDVTVPGRDRRHPGIQVHRTLSLDARDATRRYGLPVTAPARTLLDLAAVLVPRELERAIDEARTQRITTDSLLLDALGRAPHHRGARAVRDHLKNEQEPAMTRSKAEERMLALVRQADLPPFVTNRLVHGHEVDFLWRIQRVVVEVDSYQFHRSRARFENDRRRDADLQAKGYAVLRVTWRHLRQEPLFVAARLGALLASDVPGPLS